MEATDLDGGSYEVIRKRLTDQGQELARRAHALNQKRQKTFGGTGLTVIGNERVRTENNCTPRDIVNVGGTLLFGYNVFMGLKTETQISDVLSLHRFALEKDGSFDLSNLPDSAVSDLLDNPNFRREFRELYQFYKDARLLQLRSMEDGRLLAVFQTGRSIDDIKVFRWAIDVHGRATYVDNRGEKDHVFPPSHDFEWITTTRDDQVSGRHPHVSILNQVFVETVGGDLTIKVENNTEDGRGIYSEPVDEPRQSLDDARFRYARVGSLILLEILPYQEPKPRYLIFNSRTQTVHRIDALGQACVQLPEDHGIIFPGGYYLQSGETKSFDTQTEDLLFDRVIRSPNGEDVLYVFYHRHDGRHLLLPYNLIRKEVQTPLEVNGFTIFDDGKMLVFRAQPEPTRVHPMQVWQTPFVSDEHAAATPVDDSFLAKVGNKDLVRGISEAFSIQRLATREQPTRQDFEDLVKAISRAQDAYYWLGHPEVLDLRSVLTEMAKNAELIIDEFEKVQTLSHRARLALEDARSHHRDLVRELRPEDWKTVEPFLQAMTELRRQRGHVITLKDVRYIDQQALEELESELVEQFDRVSRGCVRYLLTDEALDPLKAGIEQLVRRSNEASKALEVVPLQEELDETSEGLNLLSEVIASLQIEDPAQRTELLDRISEVFGSVNRARAVFSNRRKELLSSEGRAEFAAQFKLLGQAVVSALSMADSPERCDEQLSRLLVQLEELEGRFGEFDSFLSDLATKREEIYDAFNTKKQQLLDARQRRASNLAAAADRILHGVRRRIESFSSEDDLHAYFASDPMILKARQLVAQLREIEDPVKADDVEARIKSTRQEALRNLHDKSELFESGTNIIKLGLHRFTTNTQDFELTMVPREGTMFFHVTGTEFYEPVADESFLETSGFWDQPLISEDHDVYRGEYLAASLLFDAEANAGSVSLAELEEAGHNLELLLQLVRRYAADRYEEGYERGLHDADAARILERLLTMRRTAGLLRFAPEPRALASLYWAFSSETGESSRLHRRAMSLGRLRQSFQQSRAEFALAEDFAEAIEAFRAEHDIEATPNMARMAGRYLVEELAHEHPRFVSSQGARRLTHALLEHLEIEGHRRDLDEDLSRLNHTLGEAVQLARAWIDAFADRVDGREFAAESAAMLLTPGLSREDSSALTQVQVEGLLGQHPRISHGTMVVRLDAFMSRLVSFREEKVPAYRAFKARRHDLLESKRNLLRLTELKPRVLSSFVRNQLINDVYLPLIGDNLAKQLGAAGDTKRTDLMGMLLLISPPGYGKTTLTEYVASRLGMVFMKVNGPSLGHDVTSLDPGQAPNATARQEVERVNLGFEMANNVLLYIDDIQHTHPEFLQKFISLCDGQRRVEGVWQGRSRTYDLRGKKFAVVMAGNPYTESGEKFQIPDMLANRADTYNLGDVLSGRDEVFALSYIENALTSNRTLAPVATRALSDVHLFIQMARGHDVPTTDFKHSYARVEIEEILEVLKHMFEVQSALLQVNQEYIRSASQDDRFRTEPPFKLQGSYRNMNKLAEKIVPAMTDDEVQDLISDHYIGEAQTLTSSAEHNLLKLAELRGRLTPEQAKRWEQIKLDFRRVNAAGGPEDDPVVRMTSTLGLLSNELRGIRGSIDDATEKNGDHAWLAATIDRLEKALIPLAQSSAHHIEQARSLGPPLRELIEVLRWNALQGGPSKDPP
ncbi:MAG: DNA repair ATPase [Myxococcota bacterium]